MDFILCRGTDLEDFSAGEGPTKEGLRSAAQRQFNLGSFKGSLEDADDNELGNQMVLC